MSVRTAIALAQLIRSVSKMIAHSGEAFRTPAAVTWLGHATVLLELDGVRLLTDPVLGKRVGPLVRIARPAGARDLEHVDAVLLSHLHADHLDLTSLRRLPRGVAVLVPRGAGTWLRRAGLEEVHELAAGEALRVGPVRVLATPARHDGHRPPFGPSAQPLGYVITGSRSAYFAGDTDLFDAMAALHGVIDLALLPVWGWGPKLGPGHLDPERAARAAAIIAPALAIPIHWGTFAMGRPARRPADPGWPARRFQALTGTYAPAVEVRVLAPGEQTTL
jgi:L-ascorbate metabolism protein UlaG (beta-lactamase superfamily)